MRYYWSCVVTNGYNNWLPIYRENRKLIGLDCAQQSQYVRAHPIDEAITRLPQTRNKIYDDIRNERIHKNNRKADTKMIQGADYLYSKCVH